MPKTVMTGRERFNAAMNRQDHDRVPRHETFWSDTIRRWQGEGLEGDQFAVLDLLDGDLMVIDGWCDVFPGHRQVIAEDEQTVTFVNGWLETVQQWKNRSGTPTHLGWGCTDRDKWQNTFKPALDKLGPNIDSDRIAANIQKADDKGRWRSLNGLESFEALRHLLGDVDCMIAMMEDPDWIVEMSRCWTDAMLRRATHQYEAADGNIDGYWVYGDMAFNHATMCSPQTYRELIWPDHARMAQWAHDRNIPFIYHTDGDVNGVMDLYLEAGFDCLQPLEAKANMDVRNLFPRFGDRMTFFGNIDVMVMLTNDRDKIVQEMESKFAVGKQHKGYIYHSDHSVPPQVSWETYLFIIEQVNRLGNYD